MKLIWIALVSSALMALDSFDDFNYNHVIDKESLSAFSDRPELFDSPYMSLMDKPTGGRKLMYKKKTRRLKKREKRLKSEISLLAEELREKRNKFKQIEKRTKKNRNLHTAVLRENIMNDIFSKSSDKQQSRELFRLLTDPKAKNSLKISKNDSNQSLKHKIKNIVVRTLTLADCTKIAERKLSYEKFRELKDNWRFQPVSELKRKTRMLEESGVISSLFNTVSESLGSIFNGVSEFMNSENGTYAGAAAVGGFAGAKAGRNMKLRCLTKKLMQKADTSRILVSVFRHQSDEMSRLAGKLDLSLTKIMAIDKSIGDRFEQKYSDFRKLAQV